MGEIARSKSRIASDLKTRDSNRWRPCDLKLRFETRDWRFVLNTPIRQNCEKGCDLSPRSKIASDWAIGDFAHLSLVDISDIFYFFSARGSGRGSLGRQGRGGVGFLLKIQGEGGGLPEGGGGHERAGRGSAANLGGGGLNIFFRGRKVHQEMVPSKTDQLK